MMDKYRRLRKELSLIQKYITKEEYNNFRSDIKDYRNKPDEDLFNNTLRSLYKTKRELPLTMEELEQRAKTARTSSSIILALSYLLIVFVGMFLFIFYKNTSNSEYDKQTKLLEEHDKQTKLLEELDKQTKLLKEDILKIKLIKKLRQDIVAGDSLRRNDYYQKKYQEALNDSVKISSESEKYTRLKIELLNLKVEFDLMNANQLALRQAINPKNPEEVLTIARLTDDLAALRKDFTDLKSTLLQDQNQFRDYILREKESNSGLILLILAALLPIILGSIYTVWKDYQTSRSPISVQFDEENEE